METVIFSKNPRLLWLLNTWIKATAGKRINNIFMNWFLNIFTSCMRSWLVIPVWLLVVAINEQVHSFTVLFISRKKDVNMLSTANLVIIGCCNYAGNFCNLMFEIYHAIRPSARLSIITTLTDRHQYSHLEYNKNRLCVSGGREFNTFCNTALSLSRPGCFSSSWCPQSWSSRRWRGRGGPRGSSRPTGRCRPRTRCACSSRESWGQWSSPEYK